MTSVTISTLVACVVSEVARAEGVDVDDLDFRLYDHVDLTALEHLSTADAADWDLSFSVPGHEVTVTSEHTIVVDGREPTPVTRGAGSISNVDHGV